MKNWIGHRMVELADYLSTIGCRWRNVKSETDCDYNDDCTCDDWFCMELRNLPAVDER